MKKKKSGFTLVECLVCTLVLAIILSASIPFLATIKIKQHNSDDNKEKILIELSDMNRALASDSINELIDNTTSNITVSKVENGERLYKVTGKLSKATGYITIKATE